MPVHFLSQEDIGHALGCHFLFRCRGLFALDHGQPRFLVYGDYRRLGIRFRVRSNFQTFSQQVCNRVLELSPFADPRGFSPASPEHWANQGLFSCAHFPGFPAFRQVALNSLEFRIF